MRHDPADGGQLHGRKVLVDREIDYKTARDQLAAGNTVAWRTTIGDMKRPTGNP